MLHVVDPVMRGVDKNAVELQRLFEPLRFVQNPTQVRNRRRSIIRQAGLTSMNTGLCEAFDNPSKIAGIHQNIGGCVFQLERCETRQLSVFGQQSGVVNGAQRFGNGGIVGMGIGKTNIRP